MDDLEKRIERIEEKMDKVSEKLSQCAFDLGLLNGEHHSIQLLVKFVILPLLVIVGALVGVDIALSP